MSSGETKAETELVPGDNNDDNNKESSKKTFTESTELFFPKQRKSEKNQFTESSKKSSTETLENCIAFLDGEDGLDIYQLVAFRSRTGNNPFQNGAYLGWWVELFKLFVIIIIQYMCIIVVFIYIFTEADKGVCDKSGTLQGRIMAAAFGFFLAIYIYTIFEETKTSGFYFELDFDTKIYKFCSSNYLHLGRIVNLSTLLCAIILSFFLILISENVLDMILNAVALVFIVEIDNIILSPSDYDKTRQWFEDVRDHAQTYTNPDAYIDAMFKTDDMSCCPKIFWNLIYNIIRGLFFLLLAVGVIGIPIFMAICY